MQEDIEITTLFESKFETERNGSTTRISVFLLSDMTIELYVVLSKEGIEENGFNLSLTKDDLLNLSLLASSNKTESMRINVDGEIFVFDVTQNNNNNHKHPILRLTKRSSNYNLFTSIHLIEEPFTNAIMAFNEFFPENKKETFISKEDEAINPTLFIPITTEKQSSDFLKKFLKKDRDYIPYALETFDVI